MVSNPFCNPCAEVHKKLHDWLENRDDIALKILFTTDGFQDDLYSKVAKHAIALSIQPNDVSIEVALNEWYNQINKNYDRWASIFPAVINEHVDTISRKQNDWCNSADIAFTPTIFINGYKMPTPYQIDDLKYLLA